MRPTPEFEQLAQRALAQLDDFDIGIEDTLQELRLADPLSPALAGLLDEVAPLVADYAYEAALARLRQGLPAAVATASVPPAA